ncbi:hydrogenase/urease maturation nickel metallochaperone HypA, partial [Chloroflexota bacterium]
KVRESVHPMEADSLQTLLKMIAKGTIAQEAKMRIEIIPPTLKCKECDFSFLAQESVLVCPRCRSGKLEELDTEEIDLECNFAE